MDNHELPPLRLTDEHKRMLAAVSTTPRTALDYYMLLPKSRFGILPDSPERRVTYVKNHSDDFLEASHWFECNGGGFEVTMKLFRTPERTFIAIKHSTGKDNDIPSGKREPPVILDRPSLWLYAGGKWILQPIESIPTIPTERALAKYHKDSDADRRYLDQDKFISINYVLSPSVEDIVLMGAENFEEHAHEYARLKWRDSHFVFE